nr:MAG TPA: hypothetical protein [Caudoviricetes sp.]
MLMQKLYEYLQISLRRCEKKIVHEHLLSLFKSYEMQGKRLS